MVLSIIWMLSGAVPLSFIASSISSHTPACVQRRYWRNTDDQFPKCSGRSCRAIQNIPSRTRRWADGGRPRLPPVAITNGAKNAHSSSVIILEPTLVSAKASLESRITASGESTLSTRPRDGHPASGTVVYDDHAQHRSHLSNLTAAYNFALRVKALDHLAPSEYIWKTGRFGRNAAASIQSINR